MNYEPSSEYTVAQFPHGIAVFGPLPVPHLVGLLRGAEEQGYEFIAGDIVGHLRHTAVHVDIGAPHPCSVVIVSEESGAAWRQEIDAYTETLDWPGNWLQGRHPGISSLTIFYTLSDEWEAPWGFRPAPPNDADDFGRCVRLLNMAPDEWRTRLHEVIEVHSEWGHLVLEWPYLEELYKAGEYNQLTRCIREMGDE